MILILMCGVSRAATDRVHLRSGETWTGSVVREGADGYAFVRADSGGVLQRIPRDAVRFIVYADPARADRALGLAAARRLCRDDSHTPMQILTAEGMGAAALAAAQGARRSIWIAAYYLSGSRTGPIGAFYDALRQKAQSGVDVVIVAEYGQATPPSVKNATRDFAHELAQSGVKVLLLGERKAQHKKLLIVDERIVILGSSNLTLAGTLSSNEMNLRFESAKLAHPVVRDFNRLRERAVPIEDWRDGP